MSITTPVAPSQTAAGANDALDAAARGSLDADIEALSAAETDWAALSVADRADLLDAVHDATADAARDWAKAAIGFKGLDPDSQSAGEEWQSGPYAVLLSTTLLAKTLRSVARGESPLAHAKFGTAPGNRVTVQVLPSSALEGVLYHGYDAQVWLTPGVSVDEAKASAGIGELTPSATGGVGVVLGAGNITSIPPLDVLYEIFANNRVVLLKLNPVMKDMQDVFERAMKPLIDRGFLRIIQGGGQAGSYLVHHKGISHVHITGSAATHDVIVWGPDAEGRDRKARKTPLLKKEITSELGGVAPIIVVPGKWSAADLKFQAEHVASMRLHNGGYNCIAGQIVVLSSDWDQRDAFLTELRGALNRTPSRKPWYPGSDSRVAAAKAAYPSAEQVGPDGTRLLIDVKADDDASTLLTTETFSPVLGVIHVAGVGQAFLDAAVATANTEFLGTLGANLIIDPRTRKRLGAGFISALAELRYGTIAVNSWTGFSFLAAGAPWGAFPGHDLNDVQSGIGVVHNAMLIASTERTVLTGAFRPFPRSFAGGEFSLFPKAPYFVTSRSALSTGKALVHFAKKPSWLRLPAVFAQAFRA
ncbi:MAG TPA: aldehyde dehydrogenase family protein [Galbitalea sp.]|jgi:aldehyde dehydrogenase (NAD(P)+)|nr:aldehyde dehydrogenase family protein [Galbitalea sp.]